MTLASEFQNGFNSILEFGQQTRIKYYTQSFTGSYDDDITLTQSGTDFYTSGIVQPISNKQFSSEALLLEQGKLLLNDKSLYLANNVIVSGTAPIKVGLGSPVSQEFQILENGQVTNWDINAEPIYKKMFIRVLNTGSFVGEV